MTTAREKLAALTDRLNRQLGTRCRLTLGTGEQEFVLDGSPADVRTFLDWLLTGGRAEELTFENGDFDADPDFHGWAFATFRAR